MTRKRFGAWQLCSLFLGLLFSALAPLCLGQTPPSTAQRPRKVLPPEQEPADVLRIETDLVSVDVAATNAEGRPVRNLRPEDFKVYSDGAEQPISFFQLERREGESRPLAIVFALDISGSMTADEMEKLRGALRAFSAQLSDHPAVYAVMTFGMNVKTLQRFTSEPDKLDRTFDRIAREPNGLSTHAYDAVDLTHQFYQGSAGSYVKFSTPTIANGKVYVGTMNSLVVFGLRTERRHRLVPVVNRIRK